ncbi:dynein regulatory complex subunit 5 [Salarias fasciatus]|uniref:dynein regulatory complex subunit 5 n=1 Tax=Salarias fasciatus TaxID=181472 RepID=UPI0011767798|nr:dynein regulatory complex subunit 5 [Salarias fasciatus]
MKRRILAEDPSWTLALVPRLSKLCLLSMVDNFEAVANMPIFERLNPSEKAFMEERLSPALPLRLTATLVSDGLYWRRCCEQRWKLCDVSHYSHSWKRMFFERHLENLIELFIPGLTEPKTVLDMVPLCRNYVKRLDVAQLLLPIKEPKQEEEEFESDSEPENEFSPSKMAHFDFSILLDKLTSLEELSLVYRVRQCGMNFEWKMFEMTDQDCESLAKALKSCQTLKVLRLRFSQVEDKKCRVLVKSLLDHPSLSQLDFSYNRVADRGARAVGKLLNRSKLQILDMSDNKISSHGAQAIAHALSKNSTLLSLNLRLNPLMDEGGQAIGKALMSNRTLRRLHLGGTGVTWRTAASLAKVLPQNDTLRSLVLSCNILGDVGGKALEEGVSENTSLTELDLSLTEADKRSLSFIGKMVRRNQGSENKKRLEEGKE